MLVKLYERGPEGTVYEKYKCETYLDEKFVRKKHVNDYKIFRYCPSCNSELYGEWNYHGREYRLGEFDILWVENEYIRKGNRCFEEPYDEKAKRRYKELEQEIKDITPLIKRYHDEIEDMKNMPTCPVCGGKLPHQDVHNMLVLNNVTLIESGFVNKKGEYISEMGTILAPRSKRFNKQYEEYLSEFNNAKIGDMVRCDSGRIGIKDSDSHIYLFNPYDMESILNNFRLQRKKELFENVDRRLETTIENASETEEQIKVQTDLVKADVSKLKEFISSAVQIESNIYSVTERLKELYYMSIEDEKDAFASVKRLQFIEKSVVNIAQKEYDELKNSSPEKIVSDCEIKGGYPFEPQKPQKSEYPSKPIEPTLKKVNIFNKKKATEENEELTRVYNEKCKEYAQQCKAIDDEYAEKLENYSEDYKKYEKELAEFKAERQRLYDKKLEDVKGKLDAALKAYNYYDEAGNLISTPEKAKWEMVKEEIATAEDLLKKLYAARNAIYNSGVIFGKYCNFVALSSFSEYLQSGRCTQLEGTDGAYNLYENEMRMNLIVSQLSQVLQSLEQIQKNQYVIYSAIQEANKQLSALNATMKSAAEALKVIKTDTSDMKGYMQEIVANTEVSAYYSKVNAYYSKKNAELIDALGFMIALK